MATTQKRLLITGGQGFIGRNLAEYFISHDVVFAPSHRELDLLDDNAVREYIAQNRITHIIHAANVGGARDTIGMTDTVRINLRMFFNVVRNATAVSRIVHLGSGAEFDYRHYQARMSEKYFDTFVPEDDYGFSKYIAARYILNTRDPIVGLRLFGVFGPYEKYHFRFISSSIIKSMYAKPIIIKQNARYDYLYVKDLGPIIEYFLSNQPRHKIYNVTTGSSVDLVSLADRINDITQGSSPVHVLEDGMGLEYSGSNELLRSEIPGVVFTPLEHAIVELYEWYRMRKDELDLTLLKEGDRYIRHSRIDKNTS